MTYARNNIARMQGYVPGEQPRDKRYIKLNTNESPYPPSPQVLQALAELDTSRLRLYPDPVAHELRAEAARLAGVSTDCVLCGNGSDDLLTIAVRTFVDQGGQVAYPTPSYSLYPVLADIQGAERVEVPLDSNFELPPDMVPRCGDASLLFVARPNAPTGNAFPMATMRRLCEEFTGVVWIDEAYVDFADDSCLAFVNEYPNVVVSRTLSKSYSLASVRLGIAYATPELVAEMMKVKDSYNVNMLTQVLGLAALRDHDGMRENAERIRQTRANTREQLHAMGCDVLPSAANFMLVKPPVPAVDVVAGLRDRGILVRYFSDPRVAAYFRVSIGTAEEMAAFTDALREVLAP